MHITAEAWAGAYVDSGLWRGGSVDSFVEGICICEHENLWNENPCSEICRGSAVAVLAIGFLSSKSCWGPLSSSRLMCAMRFYVMRAGEEAWSMCKGCGAPQQ